VAGKPDSVLRWSFIWACGHPPAQAAYPGFKEQEIHKPYLALLQTGFALLCLLPDGR